jgi:2-polyprenyl-3-methyl-5-hydroxy-6-metoxy-1,4-benzoquinol methylase
VKRAIWQAKHRIHVASFTHPCFHHVTRTKQRKTKQEAIMNILSEIARKKKITYFLDEISKDARILEVGSGTGWVTEYFRNNGYANHANIDLEPPADIVGDINNWQELGLKQDSYDYIIAFEVVEHVDCFKACFDLLVDGGQMLLTSPIPHMDWAMKILEFFRLNQKRTSHHDCLVYFEKVPYFRDKNIRTVGFLSQWGIFTK